MAAREKNADLYTLNCSFDRANRERARTFRAYVCRSIPGCHCDIQEGISPAKWPKRESNTGACSIWAFHLRRDRDRQAGLPEPSESYSMFGLKLKTVWVET